ncbi:MAG: hypothetical protein H6850_02605 [Alphaproteobacteria bacterium]|nr:MAG: hypothetical protein H6850_02605 [Alphaproteobacteria bacterium]
MTTTTENNCPGCPDCTQPESNKPWIFLGCCFVFDLEKTEEGFSNGPNVTTLLELLKHNADTIIWNYECETCPEHHTKSGCRTVVTMDICKLRHVLATEELSDALNLEKCDG